MEDATGECVFDEDSVQELMRTFDHGGLARVNAVPFEQITHPGVMRDVWITPAAESLYRQVDPDADLELSRAFPVGTVIVHERIDGSEGNTVQVKREPGRVGDNGEVWWFGKYFLDGSPDVDPCSPCIACHSLDMHPTTEGLFGVPRHALTGWPNID